MTGSKEDTERAVLRETEAATIGHNKPPADPFDVIENGIEELYAEAKLWLDGEPITTQKQADNLALVGDQIKKIGKEAETMRKAEKKPHDDAGKAVQAKFLPLIDKTKKALEVLDSALRPFMVAKKQAQEAEAAKAAQEAADKQREAEEAIRAAPVDNLEARESAEDKIKAAKAAAAHARKAADSRPNVKGEGRARTLVTTYEVQIVDMVQAGRAMWARHPEAYRELTRKLCQQEADIGNMDIQGVRIITHENVRS